MTTKGNLPPDDGSGNNETIAGIEQLIRRLEEEANRTATLWVRPGLAAELQAAYDLLSVLQRRQRGDAPVPSPDGPQWHADLAQILANSPGLTADEIIARLTSLTGYSLTNDGRILLPGGGGIAEGTVRNKISSLRGRTR